MNIWGSGEEDPHEEKRKHCSSSSNMTVENIAMSVGYQNVEHFNRLFKKAYDMTPMQFRNQK